MILTRYDWRVNGDLIQWIVYNFPRLSDAQIEAGYRLLEDPDVTDAHAANVEILLAGCSAAASKREEADG